jgi:DNA polymerase
MEIRVQHCLKCDLSTFRKHIVNGEGDVAKQVMIIGEAPGSTEDRYGRPFIGKAGVYLEQCLRAVSMNRNMFYITNVIKCKPYGSDKPTRTEIANCLPYLVNEIREIKPKLILSLGTYSISTLLGAYCPITRYRDKVYFYNTTINTAIYPTFHPAYILRNMEQEKVFMQDLENFRKLYNRIILNL